MTYVINSKETPIQVDFEITKTASEESRKLLAIAKFIDVNTLKMAIEFGNIRPLDFNNKKDIVVLTREK